MADEKTGPDSVRVYLTGAASDGGAQTDPDLALGKYRSSTLADFLGVSIADAISGITVDFVSGANGTGDGSLAATGASELKWTAPGGSQGDGVTIANGETKIVLDGTDPEKFVRVTRTSADALSGTATLTLTDTFNNLIGYDNVSAAERAAGDTEYRCLSFKVDAADDIMDLLAWLGTLGTARAVNADGVSTGADTCTAKSGTFADWPDSGYVYNTDKDEVAYYSERTSTVLTLPAAGRDVWDETGGGAGVGVAWDEDDAIEAVPGLRIGKEAPSAQPSGTFTDKTGAGEGSQPAGVTFAHPIASDDANVIDIGDLDDGYIYGLWLERIIIAGATAEASVLNLVEWTFDATPL